MPRTLVALALFSAVAVAQPPAENVAPRPPMTLVSDPPLPAPPPPLPAPPLPEVVTETVSVTELLPPPRVLLSADIGPGTAWRHGQLRPGTAFTPARPLNFPVPSVKFGDSAGARDTGSHIAARFAAVYQFEHLPLTVFGSWETLHVDGNAQLLGYDPSTTRLLGALNDYNEDRRKGDQEGWWPTLRMRTVPGDAHQLRTRFTANVADAVAGWKLWTPREEHGVEYRVLLGGRYAGIFTDDRAVGDRYEQTASNWFSGFGPEAGGRLNVTHDWFNSEQKRTGVFWADVRGGALFGEAVQRFREFDGIWGGDQPYREFTQRTTRTVPFVAAEVGLGSGGPRSKLSIGVRYTHYWGVGDVGPSKLDAGTLTSFLRWEVGF